MELPKHAVGGLGMDDLRNDPEYEIRWPNGLLADELEKLISRGLSRDPGAAWADEVKTLLRQAFTSTTPVEDWKRALNSSFTHEEPF